MITCQYCECVCKKDGKQKDGTQKYRCKTCKKYQQKYYRYQAKIKSKRELVIPLLVNNCGFRGINRVLKITVNTIMKLIFTSAESLKEPAVCKGCVFEIDEMKAHGKKGKTETWIVYGVERKTKNVLGISIGKRTKLTLKKTTEAIQKTNPERIYTDGYHGYKPDTKMAS